ncbi:MAG: peptidoglycan-binding domain-containing protein [Candidatus Omnitrophota bacterium]
MRRRLFIMSGFFGVLLCSGCATTHSSSLLALENRLHVLETKVEDLSSQNEMTCCLVKDPSVSDTLVVKEVEPTSVIAAKMTKEQIQLALKNIGYYDGKIDGKIGPRSKIAIKEFQKDMGLKVDGVAGRMTKEKLAKYLQGK